MFSEYVKSVITVTLCAFLCAISCSSVCKNSAVIKALRLITNLCIFSVVFLPLITAFRNIDADSFKIKSEQYDVGNYPGFDELTEKQAAESLKKQIFEKTGISVLSISIDISYENGKTGINKINAYVKTAQEKNAVLTTLYDLLGNEAVFEVKADETEDN